VCAFINRIILSDIDRIALFENTTLVSQNKKIKQKECRAVWSDK